MKHLAFWGVCAVILVGLQLASAHCGAHRRNVCFAVWLGLGVAVELAAAEFLAFHHKQLLTPLARVDAWLALPLAIGAIAEAVVRGGFLQAAGLRSSPALQADPINRVILIGMGALLAANLAGYLATLPSVSPLWNWVNTGLHIDIVDLRSASNWLRNIAFYGAGLWMLLKFSGVRFDRLPLWVSGIPDFRFQMAAAAGFARSILS